MSHPFLLSLPFRSILRSCARHYHLPLGKKLHAVITTSGLVASPSSFLRNALLHLYAACDKISYASNLFDEIPHPFKDAVDYTTLLSCFSRHSMLEDAIHFFNRMRREGMETDDITLACAFKLCAKLGRVLVGVQVHSCMVKMGLGVKACNAVMDMYVKCGLLSEAKVAFEEMEARNVVSWTVILYGVLKHEGIESAQKLFDQMPERNEVAWTIMITSYIRNGFTYQGLLLLSEMIFTSSLHLNHVSLCSFLSACSQSGDLLTGRWIHSYALKSMEGRKLNIMVSTALVDMYSKCGRIKTALKLFQCILQRNVVSWNAIFSALSMHGRGDDLLKMFPEMVKDVKPDELTFTSLLSACSHSGLVNEGLKYFNDMENLYGIKPSIEHYACMVDLLGRAGQLEDAELLIKEMPMRPNKVVLGSLIGSCSIHGKLDLGERVLQELVEIDPCNVECHVLLSNMYVSAGKIENADYLRQMLKDRGIKKVPGMSCVHLGSKLCQ